MDRLLRAAGIALDDASRDRLWRFHGLLRKHNHEQELTRLIGFESIVLKHYVDCMYVGALHALPSTLLDIGTGAGFPAIPLKIRYPELELVLAEPRPKRVAFLRLVIRELALDGVEVFEHKVTSRSFTTPVPGVITRAVETIDKTVLRTQGCTPTESQLIFMKGPSVDDELHVVLERFPQLTLKLDRAYTLPGTEHERRLVVLEKRVT